MPPIDEMDLATATEPEVLKAVVKEVKSFGDNAKKNYDELRRNYEELKATIEKTDQDALDVNKIEKLTADLSTRQMALDESFQKSNAEAIERMDQIETALKRAPRGNGHVADSFETEAKAFAIHAASVRRKSDVGISFEEQEALELSSKDYGAYCKAFEAYARKYGGARDYVMPEVHQKALQVGIDTDGGVTVPTAMSTRIISRIFESDPIRQLAASESITTGALEFMVDVGEAGYEWEGEVTGETTITGETATSKMRKVRIVAHTLAARPRATQTLLEDSGINIETWLANKIAERFLRGEAAAFVNGDGIGKPRGFLSYDSSTADANGNVTWGTVEQLNMGAAAALTADGFITVKYALKEYFLERGTWLMHRSTVAAAMKLKDGTGEYVWKPSAIATDPSSAILNLPVRMSTTMPTVAANSLSVAIADWKEAYMIVDRLGITVQRDPYTVKPFIEFYTRKRVGGDIINFDAVKIGKIAA